MKLFGVIDLVKYVIEQAKEMTLESRLSQFREDEHINAYFEMLQNGNAEERSFAEQQLMLIKSAFDQIAQYQTEYAIYSKFGNQKYMDEAHQLAEQARAQLSALGVSEKWYAADVNLRAHFMGSPLRALRYDPYKTDGSAMPSLSEQRFAIALGMINLNYQNWARKRYEFIEAGAIAAEAKRREIPLKVEEYNKTISKQNIEYVQQYLAEINLYRGEITGKYSPELLRAVERFQDNYNSSELSVELQYKFDEVNGKIDHRVLNLIYMNKDLVEKSPRNLDMCLIPGGLEDTRSVFEKTIYYFNKSIDSFKEIGSDIMVAADERANKALDSPGHFLNYISFGIPKGIYDGYAYRAENRNESAYTYIDWLSSGVLSGVYEPLVGAFNPDDPYSKEHWLDSASLVSMLLGLGAARMQLKSNSTGSGGSLNTNTNVDLNKTEKIEAEPKKTNPDPADNSLDNKGKDELRAWVEANIERSAAVREASRFDEYLKKEKELLEDIEKKKTSQPLEGTGDGVPSYGKNSVPIGPYQEVNGFPVKVKPGAQEKHIPNTPNYKQEIANGKNKSIFYGDNKTAQELLDEFAGKGQLLPNGNKERVDFGKPIGKYYDRDTGEYLETTRGMIHYGKDGAHIVPSEPLKE
ncbi:polymorphic toxin type 50 domain-containing protein [Paenibacillus lentus]|uniref:Uncharacterized protein n=1 Tax=Paenibacillus lentus TaxID=1338368 RepID=A0A3Q8S5E2_9BACL|nr:polymorphic toxin type 50 domain-containing protein [Paenibacillus lentus]AZK47332.1 hypothetical protein EIM92_15145 [Paenibacillus lentus]